MEQLNEEVKFAALIKWHPRIFKTKQDAAGWFETLGKKKCSFCDHFDFFITSNYEKTECKCPLQDFDSLCCKEFEEMEIMLEKYMELSSKKNLRYIKLKRFNELRTAIYNRIKKMKVEKE